MEHALLAAQTASDFEPHRRHLLGLAYRMLGSWSQAQDVVQDAWLRWHDADRGAVQLPRAFLARTVTRLCLDVLKSARAQREQYVGEWLPEALLHAQAYGGPGAHALAQDLSLRVLLVLRRLSPLERAAFLLHDVFDRPYDEIALALQRTPAACRQLAARGRSRVRAQAPARYRASAQEAAAIAEAFLRASREGDLQALRQLLAPQAVLRSDGGGHKLSGRPVQGGDKVARFFAGIAAKPGGRMRQAWAVPLNGMPGVLAIEPDGLPRCTALGVVPGQVVAVYLVRNPHKLGHVLAQHARGAAA